MSCEFGHCWKIVRKDKQVLDEGTFLLIQMRCKVCGFSFVWDEMSEQELDYDDLRDVVKKDVD